MYHMFIKLLLFILLLSESSIIIAAVCSDFPIHPPTLVRESLPPCYPEFATNGGLNPSGIDLPTGGICTDLPHDMSRWHQLLRRLEKQEEEVQPNILNVVVFGGSMAFGCMETNFLHSETMCAKLCSDRIPIKFLQNDYFEPRQLFYCQKCTFPARLQSFLQAAYPSTNVTVTNLARGGSSSQGILNLMGNKLFALESVDFVILNYASNDYTLSNNKQVSVGFEDLMRKLLSLNDDKLSQRISPTVVIDLPMIPLGGRENVVYRRGVYEPHVKVSSYYKVPTLSIERNTIVSSKWDFGNQEGINRHIKGTYELHKEQKMTENNMTWGPFDESDYLHQWCRANGLKDARSWLPVMKPESVHPFWVFHQILADFLAAAWKFQRDEVMCGGGEKDGTDTEGKHKDERKKKETITVPPFDVSIPLIPSLLESRQSLGTCDQPLSSWIPENIVTPVVSGLPLMYKPDGSYPVVNTTSHERNNSPISQRHRPIHQRNTLNSDKDTPSPIDLIADYFTVGNWVLSSDVLGRNDKIGWWIETLGRGAKIQFPIFTSTIYPIFILGYLESYVERMGTVLVYMNEDRENAIKINSKSESSDSNSLKVSVIKFQQLCFPVASTVTYVQPCDVKKNILYGKRLHKIGEVGGGHKILQNVTIELLPQKHSSSSSSSSSSYLSIDNKFKIVSLTSC